MQVLVTGANGRLGQILRQFWARDAVPEFSPDWCARSGLQTGDVGWDILSGPAPALAKGAVIVHLAGILRGDKAALATNSDMALAVCRAAKTAGAAHVFLASSAAVYGPGHQDHTEVEAPAPCTDYGHAKLAMEREALIWAQRVGLGVTCLRIGNVLGADALFGEISSRSPVVVDRIDENCCGPVRPFIGPAAFARVLAALVLRAGCSVTMPHILNLAATGPVAMADLLEAAQIPYQFGPLKQGLIGRVGLSTKRLHSLVPEFQSGAAALVADWQRFGRVPA